MLSDTLAAFLDSICMSLEAEQFNDLVCSDSRWSHRNCRMDKGGCPNLTANSLSYFTPTSHSFVSTIVSC